MLRKLLSSVDRWLNAQTDLTRMKTEVLAGQARINHAEVTLLEQDSPEDAPKHTCRKGN